MKKALSIMMAAGMAATMLAGCGGTAASSEAASTATSSASSTVTTAAESIVTEPTKMSFVFADGDDAFKTTVNKVVDDFNTLYPDVTIVVEPGDGGSYSEFLKTKDSVGDRNERRIPGSQILQ